MTNEEAIKLIQGIEEDGRNITTEHIEALDHAIKALEVDNAPTVEPKRKFIRIITTYHPDEFICYQEYKGKPYFSIEYQENGETFVGFGTYNPEVLSFYLRNYFPDKR